MIKAITALSKIYISWYTIIASIKDENIYVDIAFMYIQRRKGIRNICQNARV
jgi:hypothetical protein